MNKDDIVEKLNKWMTDFVEVPHPALGNWPPCPFARQARLNNTIDIQFSELTSLTHNVKESLNSLIEKEVVVICWDHTNISPELIQELVNGLNKDLMPKDYVILEDHPDAPEYVNGVRMNFGYCGLFVIQKLSKLNTASGQLKSKGYYHHWDKKALDEVVNWRLN